MCVTYLVQGVPRLEYNWWQEEEEERLGREALVEGEIFVSQEWQESVIEYAHNKT